MDDRALLIVALTVVEHKLKVGDKLLLIVVALSFDLTLNSLHVYWLSNHLYNITFPFSLGCLSMLLLLRLV